MKLVRKNVNGVKVSGVRFRVSGKLDTGYSLLDAGCSILVAGWWLQGTGGGRRAEGERE